MAVNDPDEQQELPEHSGAYGRLFYMLTSESLTHLAFLVALASKKGLRNPKCGSLKPLRTLYGPLVPLIPEGTLLGAPGFTLYNTRPYLRSIPLVYIYSS